MNERIGYDELLASRVKQLREIDERLERIECKCKDDGDAETAWTMIHDLRYVINDMVRRAESEHFAETGSTGRYAWPKTEAGARARVRFCMRMARKRERKAKAKG